MLHIDRSSNANNGDARILIQGPKEVEIEDAARLSFPITNNETAYEALILGLELTYEAGARDLEVFTDSQLVVLQIEGMYERREKTMTSYREIVKRWMGKYDKCPVSQVPKAENDKADVLSKFGAVMSGIKDRKVNALVRDRSIIAENMKIQAVVEVDSWRDEIIKYLEKGVLPEDLIKAKRLIFLAAHFTLISGARSLAQKVMRQGYFWPTMVKDTKELFPPAQSQKKFIIVAVEYFSKWVETEVVARISEKEVITFIWKNIICSFDKPRILISDNGTQFRGKRSRNDARSLGSHNTS
ncbi:UNVERIFIED_CONTAM: hypothetical protein Sindi_1305700 [Sesamum indicum]